MSKRIIKKHRTSRKRVTKVMQSIRAGRAVVVKLSGGMCSNDRVWFSKIGIVESGKRIMVPVPVILKKWMSEETMFDISEFIWNQLRMVWDGHTTIQKALKQIRNLKRVHVLRGVA